MCANVSNDVYTYKFMYIKSVSVLYVLAYHLICHYSTLSSFVCVHSLCEDQLDLIDY